MSSFEIIEYKTCKLETYTSCFLLQMWMNVLQTMEDVIRPVLIQTVVLYVAVRVDGSWTTINKHVKVGSTVFSLALHFLLPLN